MKGYSFSFDLKPGNLPTTHSPSSTFHLMNCDDDFNIPFNYTYVKVKSFCESSEVHYKVYLPEKELKIQLYTDEKGINHWREYENGETDLAKQLGRLIEEQQK